MPQLQVKALTDAEREKWYEDLQRQLSDGFIDKDEWADQVMQVAAMPRKDAR